MSKYSYVGLTDAEVEASRKEHGSNGLPPPETETFWDKLMENFDDPLIKILLVALVITVGLAVAGYAEWFEGVGIAVAVFLATFVATYSEYKNESSFQQLQEEASRVQNRVFRNGDLIQVTVGDIVVGDHILLQPGDKVPVDGRLLEGHLWVVQQALTGEPLPMNKMAAPKGYQPEEADFSDRYLVFRESIVNDGEAILVAESVGTETKYGKMAEELAENEERESPLQVKLTRLADNISTIGYAGAILIAFSFMFKQIVMDQGYDLPRIIDYLKNWQLALKDSVTALILSIIIIVVAVPEGLPMMIAIVLSLNMRKLLKAKVLVRKLLGIETAGSLNVLFVDKTGTLTKGVLDARQFVSGTMEQYHNVADIPAPLKSILEFSVHFSTASHITNDGDLVGGNATDRAFLGFVGKTAQTVLKDNIHREKEILFSSARKFSASTLRVDAQTAAGFFPFHGYKGKGDMTVTLIKGAPEMIIPKCRSVYSSAGAPVNFENAQDMEAEVTNLSCRGIRVVALATSGTVMDEMDPTLPNDMTLIGVIGILDEVRPQSKDALALVREAGVQVIMITGDREETAVAIASELNMLPEFAVAPPTTSSKKAAKLMGTSNNAVINSTDLRKMKDEEVLAILPDLRVVARAYPTDKSRLVKLAQKMNMVVGMTGDGVNDASALKKADVGFAMGSGTEVAKEASDIVIMDDNFFSIAMAILYGRTIFKSIRKFIVFQSTINAASTLIVFLGPFLGFDFPLTLIQLLWVNLVMDTLAALAFGGEPALDRYMQEKPIRRDESIISPEMWSSILINGIFVAIMSLKFLMTPDIAALFVRNGKPADDVFLTAFFSFFIFINVINALNVRTPKLNLLDHITANTGFVGVLVLIFIVQITFSYVGGRILRTVPLLPNEWLLVVGFAFAIIPFDLLRKSFIAPLLPQHIQEKIALETSDADDIDEDAEKLRKSSSSVPSHSPASPGARRKSAKAKKDD
jgi:calcium-translocating P-type ATPase